MDIFASISEHKIGRIGHPMASLTGGIILSTYCVYYTFFEMSNNAFRILGFLDNGSLVVLTNGFAKKSDDPDEAGMVSGVRFG
ncbi:MAG: hypothetical protein NT163_05150 [Chlorobiales bacterium]|nr:hypothetical protein [Chlorobiales bacterium]